MMVHLIDPENVQVDVGDGVQIRLLDIHSEFEQFNWFFKKDTFPRMQVTCCPYISLSLSLSLSLYRNEICNIHATARTVLAGYMSAK